MKALYILLAVVMFLPAHVFGQSTKDYTVLVSAKVQKNPAQIKLSWPADANANSYKIYRRTKLSDAWATIATLPSNTTTYTDNNITVGAAYEYKILKVASSYNGYGYIYAGIEMPLQETKGRLLLIVEESLKTPLANEIHRLKNDIAGDGWTVKILYVSKDDKVTDVKKLIKTEYSAEPTTKALFLLGHVTVPYSGNYAPDHHFPDHQGAWPADVFYADINDETWTDFSVDSDVASRDENDNTPGDGKYDQDIIPSGLELQVGRVDLYNMSAFGSDEITLLKRYLDKDHAWRTGSWKVRYKGVIDDNFGTMGGEAFAASSYNGFSAMFGDTNIVVADYFTSLTKDSFIWSHGNGGGSYTSAGGIGSTADFASKTTNSVFTSLFGSYFGDWDVANSFLRAPLAGQGMVLANAWSGRPQFTFHHMALGENIGYSAWLSQNDYKDYFRIKMELFAVLQSDSDRLVTPALMGDPTLRMHIVAPPKLTATRNGNTINLSWSKSADPEVTAYYVYRTVDALGGIYTRVAVKTASDTTYTDNAPLNLSGRNYYMVRAVKLQQSGSGSYFNLSTGSIDSVGNPTSVKNLTKSVSEEIKIYPNPATKTLNLNLNNAEAGNFVIRVTDVLGKEILLQNSYISTGKNASVQINIEALPKGIYTIQLNGKNVQAISRFIKS